MRLLPVWRGFEERLQEEKKTVVEDDIPPDIIAYPAENHYLYISNHN